jgi:hypothetical protein
MNMCAKFHRATFSTLGDIPGTLNLESGRETGRGSGRKFVRDLLEQRFLATEFFQGFIVFLLKYNIISIARQILIVLMSS